MPSRDLANEIGTGTPHIVLYFLMALGLIIILSACFNYMNLSLARSVKRSKEIGIRKVVGARGDDVARQFLTEAVLISLLVLHLCWQWVFWNYLFRRFTIWTPSFPASSNWTGRSPTI